DQGLINLDDAAKLIDIFHQCYANLVAHSPSSFVGTETEIAIYLKGAHAFLAGEHEVDHTKPVPQRLVCVLKNRPGDNKKTIAVFGALLTLPMPFARGQVIDGWITATRAINAFRPATGFQIGFAGILMGKHGLELFDGKLMNGFRFASHGNPLSIERYSITG